MIVASLQKSIQTFVEKSGWQKLEKRERHIVLAGICFFFCLALFHFAISPLFQMRKQTEKAIAQDQENIEKIEQLQMEYLELQDQGQDIQYKIDIRDPTFTLFSYIEERAAKVQVKGQMHSMTPSNSEGEGPLQEARVDLKLEQITMRQLVDFLQAVESPDEAVLIKRISIQENSKTEGLLDVVMQVITFVKKA